MNDALFRPPPERPQLVETAAEGGLDGLSYTYRDAAIDCQKRGCVCRLHVEGHPLDGQGFGSAGTITPLVDLWVDEKQLPSYMRLVPLAPKQRTSEGPSGPGLPLRDSRKD